MSSDRPPQSLDPLRYIQDLQTTIEQKDARIKTLRADLSAEELDARTLRGQLEDALLQRLKSAPAFVGIVNSLANSTTIHGVHPDKETVGKLQIWLDADGNRIRIHHLVYAEVKYQLLPPHPLAFEVTNDGNDQPCAYYVYPFTTLPEAEAWLREMKERREKQVASATVTPTPA